MGVLGVVLSTFLNAAVWGTILGVSVWRSAGIRFERAWARKLLAYGAPLVPAMLAQFSLHFGDRFFLVHHASTHELGIYALAYRFALLVPAFSGIVVSAWWPWAFSIAKEPEAERHLRDAAALLMTVTAALCSGVILFTDPVLRVVAAEPYWVAARYVPPLVVAYWFFGVQTPLSLGAHLAKRTDALAVVNIVSAVACLGLNSVLIPRYRAWGATAATLVSFALLAVLTLYASHLFRPIPQRWGVIFGSLGCVAVAAAATLKPTAVMPSPAEIALRGVLWLVTTAGLCSWLIAPYARKMRWNEWVARIASR
jgi:O-antigen/teichoic acid export membrane protein